MIDPMWPDWLVDPKSTWTASSNIVWLKKDSKQYFFKKNMKIVKY